MASFEYLKSNVKKRIQINDEDLDRFTQGIRVVHHKKKERLLEAGQDCNFQLYVNRGVLRTFYTDARGSDHTIMFSFEDWWAGDIASFVSGEPAFFSIDVLEEAELFLFDKEYIERIYNEMPVFERFFRILVMNSLVAFQKRLISTMSQSAEERYLALTAKFPALELRVAQHHIASYLGISPEALSRIRKAIIEKEKKR